MNRYNGNIDMDVGALITIASTPITFDWTNSGVNLVLASLTLT